MVIFLAREKLKQKTAQEAEKMREYETEQERWANRWDNINTPPPPLPHPSTDILISKTIKWATYTLGTSDFDKIS